METIQKPILVQDLGTMYPTENSKWKKRYGIYLCSCGTKFKVQTRNIKNGNTSSCGCYHNKLLSERNTVHNLSKHPTYSIWGGMIDRVTNANSHSYKNYGGRGISVCDEWRSFERFYEDMGKSYKKGLSIDRIDVNGNYEKSNCRWTTNTIQAQNTRLICSTNKSGFRGVSWKKQNKKWVVQISINDKKTHIGYYDDVLDAAKAYDKYVLDNNLEHTINGVLNEQK